MNKSDEKLLMTLLGKTQPALKQYCADYLTNLGYNPVVPVASAGPRKPYHFASCVTPSGYVFAQGTHPVLLVAHLDTVHKSPPSKVFRHEFGRLSSPQGIGGDDRCGVFIILKILERLNCSVLFTEDEEIGAGGAEAFIREVLPEWVENVNYIVEFDRRGRDDAVYYDCCNEKFIDFVAAAGFVAQQGTFSDIGVIAPELKIAAVNLSSGYYHEHTVKEVIDPAAMEEIIEKAVTMLSQKTDRFKYESAYGSGLFNMRNDHDAYDEQYRVLEALEDMQYRLTALEDTQYRLTELEEKVESLTRIALERFPDAEPEWENFTF
jgi:acetylornithine deacetylase/succinyl-diaminopimelate desuccinylase-like protein